MGSPAFYISRGLNNKPLAAFFAVSIIIALGFIGNMVQANSIADGFHKAFEIPQWATGIFVFAIAGFIFIGGVRRIASFAEKWCRSWLWCTSSALSPSSSATTT